jgi:hypothetical protein
MSCLSIEDLRNFPACCDYLSNVCCSDEAIQQELDLAYAYIEAITNTKFCPVEECRLFCGSGDSTLFFNSETTDALILLDSVKFIKCCGSEEVLSELPANCINRLEFLCKKQCFPKGTKNIEICGTWGTTMPLAVQKAIFLLALEGVSPGITGLQSSQGMVDSMSWDDFSINYNTADIDLGEVPVTTGFPYIDRLIFPFIPTSSLINFFVIGENDKNFMGDCDNGSTQC